MLTQALNHKLQQLCTSIGLLKRNAYYPLRRTAIIEVRRHHSTEKAKDIAFHEASGTSLFYYDNMGSGDTNMQSFRLGGSEGMTQDEVRTFFSQSNTSRWQAGQDEDRSLQEIIDERIKSRLPLHPACIAKQVELTSLYEEVNIRLQWLQLAGVISDMESIPYENSANDDAKFRSMVQQYNLPELAERIDKQLAARKSLCRSIRLQLRKAVVEELNEDHQAQLALNIEGHGQTSHSRW